MSKTDLLAKRTYTCSNGVSVIYEGSKSLWKSRTNIEIFIANHSLLNCFEIVCYNSIIGIESERIYINTLILAKKVDQNELEERVSAKKETFMRQKKSFDKDSITKEASSNIMINYIISRINIPSDLPSGSFKVILSQFSGDIPNESNPDVLDIICEKPEGIEPLYVLFKKHVT